MKVYIVYFRTMENSPEVEIVSVTTDKQKTETAFAKAKEKGQSAK